MPNWFLRRNTQGPQRFSNSQRTEAAAILAAHKTALEAIADALTELKTLDGEQIDAIISEAVARNALEAERATEFGVALLSALRLSRLHFVFGRTQKHGDG
jgi:hypothetical protein